MRFTSPHPAEFTDDVIEAMAATPNVMPQLHMPLQSGSDRVLKAMRRSYRQAKYLSIIDRVRAAMPQAAITTDIIVGFPGETEDDFAETMEVVRRARFANAYTFQYSKRPGTPAVDLPDQITPDVVTDRYERLVELVNDVAWSENKRLVGRRVELMVSEGEGRKDAATHRLSGRGPDNRLVHFSASPVVEERAPASVSNPVLGTWSSSRSPRPLRTISSPMARCSTCGVPAPAMPGRRAKAGRSSRPESRSGCRASTYRSADGRRRPHDPGHLGRHRLRTPNRGGRSDH